MKIIILFAIFSFYAWSDNSCLNNVKTQFEELSSDGREIPIKVKDGVFEKKSYILRPLNNLGIDNHFQGIQRLPGENNFVITGSDIHRKRGDLVIINQGNIVKREVLDVWPYWHPGGIQVVGNILAVPVEEYKKTEISKIYFYDLNNVLNPKKLPILIDIPQTKSGAVFFQRLPSGNFLVGSYNMSRIDFYFSKTSNLLDGFEQRPQFGINRESFNLAGRIPFNFGAQGVNLIPQCDGKLFIVLFENTGKSNPVFSKDDRALLFSLDLNSKQDQITLISSKIFKCGKKCNFAAAAGTYINNEGKLFIYSSPHFLSFNGKNYSILEFGPKMNLKQSSF